MTEIQQNILCVPGYTNDKTDCMSKRIPFDEIEQGLSKNALLLKAQNQEPKHCSTFNPITNLLSPN